MKKLILTLTLFCVLQETQAHEDLVLTWSQAKVVIAERNQKRSELTEKIGKACTRIRNLEEKRLPLIRKLFLGHSALAVSILSAMGSGTYTTGQAVRHLVKQNFSKSAYYSLGSVAALAVLAAINSIPPFTFRPYLSNDSLLGDIVPAWHFTRKKLKKLKAHQMKNFAELDKIDDAPCITVISME